MYTFDIFVNYYHTFKYMYNSKFSYKGVLENLSAKTYFPGTKKSAAFLLHLILDSHLGCPFICTAVRLLSIYYSPVEIKKNYIDVKSVEK